MAMSSGVLKNSRNRCSLADYMQICIIFPVNKQPATSKRIACDHLSLFYDLLFLWNHKVSQVGGASKGCPVIWCNLFQPELTARLYIVAQRLVQLSSECLQEWRLKHTSGEALEQDFLHSHQEKGLFLASSWNFPCCNFQPLPLAICCVLKREDMAMPSL